MIAQRIGGAPKPPPPAHKTKAGNHLGSVNYLECLKCWTVPSASSRGSGRRSTSRFWKSVAPSGSDVDGDEPAEEVVHENGQRSLSAFLTLYRTAPDLSALAHKLERVVAPSSSRNDTPPSVEDSPCSIDDAPPAHDEGAAKCCFIDGPQVRPSPVGSWGHALLLDDEVVGERPRCEGGDAAVVDHAAVTGECGTDTGYGDPILEQFIRKILDDLWVLSHPDPDFDTEAERAKTLPRLLDQTVKYIGTLLCSQSSCSNGGGPEKQDTSHSGPLTTRYPLPQFHDAPLTKQCNRLMRWLKTWRREHGGGGGGGCAENEEGSNSDDDDDGKQQQQPLWNATGGKSSRELSPLAQEEGGGSILESSFLFDSRGRRHSARIARNEALERQREEEEERMRQQQKGYFSNDTSGLFRGGVSTAGGEGSMTNMVVVTGPCGIGKTAAAYYVAGRMGYRVVEINTSAKRSPKMLERLIAEATQSRQIQTRVASGRCELEKWRAEAEEKKRLEAAAANEVRKRQEADEAAARAKREIEDAANREEARRQAKRAAGVKKENGISKAAIASFFQPTRVKSKPPPPDAVVLDVDETEKATPQVVERVGDEDDSISIIEPTTTLPPPPDPPKEICSGRAPTRKRARNETIDVAQPPAPIVVMEETEPHKQQQQQQERFPLILIESADVMMDDELQRPFYAAIRAMASESKYPIILTANEMSAQQVASYFGTGTPHATMEPPQALHAVPQLLALILVEQRLVVATTKEDSTNHQSRTKRSSKLSVKLSTDVQCLHDALALVHAAVCFVGGDAQGAVDIRRSLHRLQFLSVMTSTNHLQPAAPKDTCGGEQRSNLQLDDVDDDLTKLPFCSLVDLLCASYTRTLQCADCTCFGVDAADEDDAPTGEGSSTVHRTAQDDQPEGQRKQPQEEPVTQVAVKEGARCCALWAAYTTIVQPAMAWFQTSTAVSITDVLNDYKCPPGSSPPPRTVLCARVTSMLHRTRSMAAKAYATRSPTAISDVLQYGSSMRHK